MGVPHEERNISRDPEARRQFLQQGYDLLPVVEVGDTIIASYSHHALIEALVREGYL